MNHSSPAWKGLGGVGLIVDGGSVLEDSLSEAPCVLRKLFSSCSKSVPAA